MAGFFHERNMKSNWIIIFCATNLLTHSMDKCSRKYSDENMPGHYKKSRVAIHHDELKKDLLQELHSERAKPHNFVYAHCDASFVESVFDVVSKYRTTGQEDYPGLEVVRYVFNHDVYNRLARYLIDAGTINKNARLYHPDRLFTDALITQNSLRNAELLLKAGACPNIVLYYPIVLKGRIEHVPMCGLSVLTREEDTPRLVLLLRYGANPNIKGKEENPLYCAVTSRRATRKLLVSLLLYYGANPKQPLLSYRSTELSGRTPLECAAEKWRYNNYSEVDRDIYELCLNGPGRCAQKMAQYLWRVINGKGTKTPFGINGQEFPLELCFVISEYLYGGPKPRTMFDALKNCSFNKIRIKK